MPGSRVSQMLKELRGEGVDESQPEERGGYQL